MTIYRPTYRSTKFPTYGTGGFALPWDSGLFDSSSGVYLDLTNGGTFARSTDGYYWISAPTDGTVAFMADAAPNVRRLENRGDGLGALLLMEGSRTNRCLQSRNLTGNHWSAGNAVITENAANGPDGTLVADQSNGTSGQLSNFVLQQGLTTGQTGSVWRRTVSGTVSHQLMLGTGAGLTPVVAKASTTTTTYSQIDAYGSSFAGSAGLVPSDGEDQTAVGGQTSRALNVYVDMIQLEVGAFPTSYIFTTDTPTTRGAEVLSYNVGQYPASFLTRGFQFSFAPLYSSAEIQNEVVSGNISYAWSIGGVNQGGGVHVNAGVTSIYAAGSAGAVENTVTFSRGQLITVTVEPTLGRLTIAGCTTGNGVFTGTIGALTSAAFFVGCFRDSTKQLYGRLVPKFLGV